jgi:hypothetical protein
MSTSYMSYQPQLSVTEILFFLVIFGNKFSINMGLTYIISQFILRKLMVEQR